MQFAMSFLTLRATGPEAAIYVSIANFSNLEFGWVKCWRMTFISPICQSFPSPEFCAIWYIDMCHVQCSYGGNYI